MPACSPAERSPVYPYGAVHGPTYHGRGLRLPASPLPRPAAWLDAGARAASSRSTGSPVAVPSTACYW